MLIASDIIARFPFYCSHLSEWEHLLAPTWFLRMRSSFTSCGIADIKEGFECRNQWGKKFFFLPPTVFTLSCKICFADIRFGFTACISLNGIQKEQADSEIMVTELSLGWRVKAAPKQKWLEIQSRLQRIVENYNEFETDEKELEFLKPTAYNINIWLKYIPLGI